MRASVQQPLSFATAWVHGVCSVPVEPECAVVIATHEEAVSASDRRFEVAPQLFSRFPHVVLVGDLRLGPELPAVPGDLVRSIPDVHGVRVVPCCSEETLLADYVAARVDDRA